MSKKDTHTQNFDHLLRSKFRNEAVNPRPELWKNIQRQVTPTTPVKPWYFSKGFLLGVSIAVAAAAIIVLFHLYTNAGHTSENSNTQKYTNPKVASLIPKTKSASRLIQNKPVSTNNLYQTPKTNNNKPGASGLHLNRKIKTVTKEKVTDTLSQIAKGNKNSQASTGMNISVRNDSLLKQPHTAKNKITTLTPITTQRQWGNSVTISLPVSGHFLYSGQFISKSERQNKYKTKGQNNDKQKNKKHKEQEPSKTNRSQTGMQTENHSQKQKTAKIHKKNKQVFSRFRVKSFFSPGFSWRLIKSNPDYSGGIYSPSYFNTREKYRITINFGLTTDYQISHKWHAETGLEFYNYEINFSTESSYLENNNDQTISVYTSAGKSILIYDSPIGDSTLLFTEARATLKFRYLSVPVILKFYPVQHFFVRFGTLFDFYLNQSSQWQLLDNGKIKDVASQKIEGIRHFNISLSAGMGYEKKLGKHFGFSVATTFRIQLQNLNPKNTVRTYPAGAGLSFSIFYRF